MSKAEIMKDLVKELLGESRILNKQDRCSARLAPNWEQKLMHTHEKLRHRQLAAIHIGKKALRMTDEIYREMLNKIGGVQSAAELDDIGRRAVLNHMRTLGFVDGKVKRTHDGRPRNMDSVDRGAQLRKVEAMLFEANRPWAYVDEIASRVCKVERVAWCTPEQLRKVIAALVYNAKREGRRIK